MSAAWTREVATPEFMRSLDTLVLQRRRAGREESDGPEGHVTRSSGLDWVGHRPYQPGDDLRYLDWSLLARVGKPYVRRFLAEHAQRTDLLIDCSGSMTLGRPSKLEVACALAFAIGYVASSAGARVGAGCFADRMLARLPAGRGPAHRARLLEFLAHVPRGERTAFAGCVRGVAGRTGEIGQVVVLSDLLDDDVEEALGALRARGFDVAVVRLRSAEDEDPGFPDDVALVVDVETGRRRAIHFGAGTRERYRQRRAAEAASFGTFCGRAGITLAEVVSERPLREIVFERLRAAGLFD